MRLVLDTDILVAGLRSAAGASRVLLEGVLGGSVETIVTVALVLEYEAVATRAEHLQRSRLTRGDVLAVIDAFVAASHRARVAVRVRPSSPDPADDMLLEAALSGGADAIVTFNIRHVREAAARFNVRVLRPADAIQELREELQAS